MEINRKIGELTGVCKDVLGKFTKKCLKDKSNLTNSPTYVKDCKFNFDEYFSDYDLFFGFDSTAPQSSFADFLPDEILSASSDFSDSSDSVCSTENKTPNVKFEEMFPALPCISKTKNKKTKTKKQKSFNDKIDSAIFDFENKKKKNKKSKKSKKKTEKVNVTALFFE